MKSVCATDKIRGGDNQQTNIGNMQRGKSDNLEKIYFI